MNPPIFSVSLFSVAEIRAAPLWNNSEQAIVAMLTVTDFINTLRYGWLLPQAACTLMLHQIDTTTISRRANPLLCKTIRSKAGEVRCTVTPPPPM